MVHGGEASSGAGRAPEGLRQPLGRRLERVAQQIAHGQLEVDLVRWDRRFEPLFVDGVDLASLDQAQDFSVDDFLESEIIFAQGDTLGVLHRAVPGTLGDIATRWPGALLDIASADLLSEVGP